MVFEFRRITYSAEEAGPEQDWRLGKNSWNGKRSSTRISTKRLNCRDESVCEHVAIRIKLNRRVHPSLLLIQKAWFMRWSVL